MSFIYLLSSWHPYLPTVPSPISKYFCHTEVGVLFHQITQHDIHSWDPHQNSSARYFNTRKKIRGRIVARSEMHSNTINAKGKWEINFCFLWHLFKVILQIIQGEHYPNKDYKWSTQKIIKYFSNVLQGGYNNQGFFQWQSKLYHVWT